MAKGLFTQGMCVLLREPLTMAEIESRLSMFKVTGRQESIEDDAAPATLVMEYRPEVDGHLLITPSAAVWPDDMGEPDENPEAFVAWSLGQFGPLTYPGCLGRALEQSELEDGVRDAAEDHTAHVRVLISYVIGADDDDDNDEDLPLMPDGYDATHELQTVTRAITALLESPAAICYFNPGGEVMMDASQLRQHLNDAWNRDITPLRAWIQTRHLPALSESENTDWHVIDTVGHGQLDIPDLEASYIGSRYEAAEVARFLGEITAELLSPEMNDETFLDGEVREGPGERSWYSFACGDALNAPPRPTLRWVPDDGSEPPELILNDMADEGDDDSPEWMDDLDSEIFDSDDDDDDEEDGDAPF